MLHYHWHHHSFGNRSVHGRQCRAWEELSHLWTKNAKILDRLHLRFFSWLLTQMRNITKLLNFNRYVLKYLQFYVLHWRVIEDTLWQHKIYGDFICSFVKQIKHRHAKTENLASLCWHCFYAKKSFCRYILKWKIWSLVMIELLTSIITNG